MSGKAMTLIAIVGFVALVLGSFIWFIATWDAEAEAPVSQFEETTTSEARNV